MVVVVLGDSMYMFGGWSGIFMGEGDNNDMYMFNICSKEWWKLFIIGDVFMVRSYYVMMVLGNVFYVFGGCM